MEIEKMVPIILNSVWHPMDMGENYQYTKNKYAYVREEDDGSFTPLHPFILCRDFFNDTLCYEQMSPEIVITNDEQFGFEFKKLCPFSEEGKHPPMLMHSEYGWSQQMFRFFEQQVLLGTATIITPYSNNYWLIRLDERWYNNSATLHYITYLMRFVSGWFQWRKDCPGDLGGYFDYMVAKKLNDISVDSILSNYRIGNRKAGFEEAFMAIREKAKILLTPEYDASISPKKAVKVYTYMLHATTNLYNSNDVHNYGGIANVKIS